MVLCMYMCIYTHKTHAHAHTDIYTPKNTTLYHEALKMGFGSLGSMGVLPA